MNRPCDPQQTENLQELPDKLRAAALGGPVVEAPGHLLRSAYLRAARTTRTIGPSKPLLPSAVDGGERR